MYSEVRKVRYCTNAFDHEVDLSVSPARPLTMAAVLAAAPR